MQIVPDGLDAVLDCGDAVAIGDKAMRRQTRRLSSINAPRAAPA